MSHWLQVRILRWVLQAPTLGGGSMKRRVVWFVVFLGPSAMLVADRIAHSLGFCLGF